MATQIEQTRRGVVTIEMEAIAQDGGLSPGRADGEAGTMCGRLCAEKNAGSLFHECISTRRR